MNNWPSDIQVLRSIVLRRPAIQFVVLDNDIFVDTRPSNSGLRMACPPDMVVEVIHLVGSRGNYFNASP